MAPASPDLSQDRVLVRRLGRRQRWQRRELARRSSARTAVSSSLSARPRAASSASCSRSSGVGGPLRPLLAAFCSARNVSSSARSARQRSSSSSTRSIAAAAPALGAPAPCERRPGRGGSAGCREWLPLLVGGRATDTRSWSSSSWPCRRRLRRCLPTSWPSSGWSCSPGGRRGDARRGGERADRLLLARGHARDLGRLAPGVGGDEFRDVDGVLSDDHVLGHDRAREAAVLDRVQHAVDGPFTALVEVRAR